MIFTWLQFLTSCFLTTRTKSTGEVSEETPTEKHTKPSNAAVKTGNEAVFVSSSSSSKNRPSSRRRISSGGEKSHSFKIEISLTRILSLKKKQTETKVPDLEDLEYRKEVAKRWRIRRDNALKHNLLYYEGTGDAAEFQRKTDIVPYLLSIGFVDSPQGPGATGIVLKRGQQVYVSKEAFKPFFQDRYGIMPYRSPYEAYVTYSNDPEQKTVVKLLEKKQGGGNGALEPKLWTSISWKKEYEITLGEAFCVDYAICLDSDLEVQFKNLNIRKFTVVNTLLNENHIPLFFGEQADYLKQLNTWAKIH